MCLPRRSSEVEGDRGCSLGHGEAPAVSSPGTPREWALPETAGWEGPAPGGREEVRGADCGGHRSCFGFPPRTILAPRLSSVVRPAPAGDLCVSPGVPGQPQGTGTVLEPREEGRDGALLLVNLKPDNVLF